VLTAEGSDGSRARGYQVYRWIERHATDAKARLTAMTLEDKRLELSLGDLDLSKPIEAFAYTSEKVFYLRTNLAENFPISAVEILASKEENVPDITDGFLERNRSTVRNMLSDFKDAKNEKLSALLSGMSDRELEQIAGRLIAFDNARSMLDIAKVLPTDRVFVNPLEPCKLVAIMLLKRNADNPSVLSRLKLDAFMERLLIGETPDKKLETAYNAYRAVDDKEEREFIEGLRKQSSPSRTLYSLFVQASRRPVSLEEEFELFRVMHGAGVAYDLNTTLQKDPAVKDKREAVSRTLAIIARTLDEQPQDIHLSIDNYRSYIGQP